MEFKDTKQNSDVAKRGPEKEDGLLADLPRLRGPWLFKRVTEIQPVHGWSFRPWPRSVSLPKLAGETVMFYPFPVPMWPVEGHCPSAQGAGTWPGSARQPRNRGALACESVSRDQSQ